ncbi:MAG: hypothetical protein IIC99_11615 [Chloroflexi bacterium]|nr:hypothetical protein [Chloroflexota bacterium]
MPAADGRFSVELPPGPPENPVLVEIVASTAAGGRAWIFTAALPTGDGITAWIGTVAKVSGGHPSTVGGETGISLMTGEGLVELTSTPATVVHIPGQLNRGQTNRNGDEPPVPSVKDIAVGDRAAISATGGRILHLVVLPKRPINTLHFSGVVLPPTAASPADAWITLRDRQGNQVSAALSPAVTKPPPGSLVTAILARPSGGQLRITGLESAGSSLGRVSAALELARDAGDTAAVAGLLRGLAVTANRNLTLLNQASSTSAATMAGMAREEMAVLQDSYNQTLVRFEGNSVLLQAEGIITSLGPQDPQGRKMIVESDSGTWELSLNPQTAVWLIPAGTPPQVLSGWLNRFAGVLAYSGEYGGSGIGIDRLDLGRRVIAAYDPETLEVARMAALAFPRLEDDLARSLFPLARKGEIVGKVNLLDLEGPARSVYLQDQATGGTVIFSAAPESQILINGLPGPLGPGIVGQTVSILFEPDSGEIIEMSALDLAPGLDSVSGVVSSFVSKTFPGNVTIMTLPGESTAFTHDQDTVIRRDGRRISVNDVRLGDLVRPDTRFRTPTSARPGDGGPVLKYLSLKSPRPTSVSGTVRGLVLPLDGNARITLITDGLDVLTLAVTADTGITRLEIEIQINSLRIGDRIKLADYDPIKRELIQLDLAATTP